MKTLRKNQRGIVLPTILVLLLVLSVGAVLIVEQVGTQTRMAANSAASNVAMQGAEATLSFAISKLIGGAYTDAMFRSNAGGLYFFNAANYSVSTPPPWSTAAGWASAIQGPTITVGSTPIIGSYIIEELPNVVSPGSSSQKAFRITARFAGPGNQGLVTLQTLYKI